MQPQVNSAATRAILHALPTAVLALDSAGSILVANSAAAKLLSTPREHLEGGSLSRFTNDEISSAARSITFTTSAGTLDLIAIGKEVIVDDFSVTVVLLKTVSARQENNLSSLITQFAQTKDDPYEFVCSSLVGLKIAQEARITNTSSTSFDVLASTAGDATFESTPTISRTITHDDMSNIELCVIPDSLHGLTHDDIAVIDMFISLLHLRMDTLENATDASGSETALALALKAGDMGMCFFDTARGECYLSDRLATWCGLNPETFSGTIDAWLETFQSDDRQRIQTLFTQLYDHKKFRTVVSIHTLEQDIRLELFGRPLHDESSHEWVAIAKPFRDEQEVEAAWTTRIAMEEAARIEAEENLETFEQTLVETLLPTTSDVSIIHSRQDAGTWHIVRPFGNHGYLYAVGAVVSNNRSAAVVGATLTATMADVLASEVDDVELFVSLVRDHARARDIETSIAAVRVVGNRVSAATHAGASAYISGRPIVGTMEIDASTALSMSSHSEASPETIDVAANGRPWRIISCVIEVISLIDVDDTPHLPETTQDTPGKYIDHEDVAPTETTTSQQTDTTNVSPFRSGSISPS